MGINIRVGHVIKSQKVIKPLSTFTSVLLNFVWLKWNNTPEQNHSNLQ